MSWRVMCAANTFKPKKILNFFDDCPCTKSAFLTENLPFGTVSYAFQNKFFTNIVFLFKINRKSLEKELVFEYNREG